MKLSIIIPLYNQEKLIIKALDSIRDGFDIETIVIDDCSTDNSYNVVLNYIEHYPQKNIVLLYNDVNLGVGLTINKGLDNATGEYIGILCSDDYYIKPIDVILKELDGTDLIYYNLRINDGQILKLDNKTKNNLVGATKLMRKEFVGGLRRSEKRYKGDKDFYDELLKKNPTEKFTDIVFYHYNYPRENSLIWQIKNKKNTGDFKVKVKILKKFRDKFNKEINYKPSVVMQEIICDEERIKDLVRKKLIDIIEINLKENKGKKVVFYLSKIHNSGLYQKLYNLLYKIKDNYNITVLYDEVMSIDKLIELAKIVRVKKLIEPEEAEVCVFSSLAGRRDELIKATKKIQDINCCIEEIDESNLKFREDIDVFVAVSKEAAKQFENKYNVKPIVINNDVHPLINELAKEKVALKRGKLNLVTVSRLTVAKGLTKMYQMAKILKENNVDFVWYIVGEQKQNWDIEECEFVGHKTNPFPYVKNADYLVQLSDFESDCLSVSEALSLNVPVIVTNWRGIEEKVKDGKNGYIINHDLNNFDIDKIVMNIPKVNQKPKEHYKKWLDIL